MEREEREATAEEERASTADIAAGAKSQERADDRAADEEAGDSVRDRTEADEGEPLIGEEATRDVRVRWEGIQAGFVDEPRRAVEEADSLVAELMRQLADSFAHERERLEGQWDRGDEVSTEDLRVAFQRYRSFFDRLLSA
jgi:hypothetical protein